jgi:hypothetical protein
MVLPEKGFEMSGELRDKITSKLDAAAEATANAEPDRASDPATEGLSEEAQQVIRKQEETESRTEPAEETVTTPEEGDTSAEAEESTETAPSRYELPADAEYPVKVNGETVWVSGKALSDAYGRRRDLEGRGQELRAEREALETARQDFSRQVEVRTGELLYSQGLINERGEWTVDLDAVTQRKVVEDATAQATTDTTESAEIPTLNPEMFGEDSYLPSEYLKYTSDRDRAFVKMLSDLNAKVEAVATRTEKAEKFRDEEIAAKRKQDIETRIDAAVTDVGAPAELADDVRTHLIWLLNDEPHLFRDLPEASKRVRARIERIRGAPLSQETPTTESPPQPTALSAPPAAGGGGTPAPSPEPGERKRINLDSPRAVENIADRIKERLNEV